MMHHSEGIRAQWCAVGVVLTGMGLVTGCAATPPVSTKATPDQPPPVQERAAPTDVTTVATEPVLPPRLAMLAGLMPLRSTGVDTFRLTHPTYDGRGVLIGILDTGIDPAVPGFLTTTTGVRKILDVRDFSGEGRIDLHRLEPNADSITIDGHLLTGFGRVARMASPPYYGGVFREWTLGDMPAADVNGDGDGDDEFPVVAARASTGWVVITDTDSDRSLADERPIRDYAATAEWFTYRAGPDAGRPGPMTVVVNFSEDRDRPILDFVVDNSSHGTHVSGTAAGHNMFGVEGFDGVAPGAQLLALKISNNARGGISVTGSMLRAMNYAAAYADRRDLPLVLNLSFSVGNETEGTASIDSLVDEFALKHPDVLFVVSAGNDGPGLSTIGYPGSAALGLSVCALFPGVFARPPEPGRSSPDDVLGWWSARGGEVAKPDLCAPGVAFSNVPAWHVGEEISLGTSMAAPQVAGAAALLLSAMRQRGRTVRAIDLKRSLIASASPLAGTTILDEGAGLPNVTAAYRWLLAAHQTGVYAVRALPDGGNTSASQGAYRRAGLASPADTLQRFLVTSVGGQPAARLLLRSDASWLHVAPMVEPGGQPVTVTVAYDAAQLTEPGLYVGTAWARAATDTMAGPSFGLTNAVIIPHSLASPLRASGMLTPGAVARYFLDVPEGSGGVTVRLTMSRSAEEATLYLFEPSGQPYRSVANVTAGGGKATTATIAVKSDEVIAGVYEAVVVAHPADAAKYTLTADLPSVYASAIGSGPSAVLENRRDVKETASLDAEVVGAIRAHTVSGASDEPVTLRVPVLPHWADTMVVDVELPVTLWSTLTDFGVTVFDSTGRKVSDGPLNYAFGRLAVELDSTSAGAVLDLELFPGFAHLEPPTKWTAEVRIAFTARDPVPLSVLGQSASGQIELPPEARSGFQFSPVPVTFEVPDGFAPLVEVTVRGTSGAAAIRRGPSGR